MLHWNPVVDLASSWVKVTQHKYPLEGHMKDLDQSSVQADAERGEAIMFGKNMTATELKYQLTEPKLGHAIPAQFVEDFFEFAAAVNCDLTLMAFYRWYRMPSLTTPEWEVLDEALKAHRAMLHMHLRADIEGGNSTDPGHEHTRHQAETLTSLINRLGLCPHHDNTLWCVLDRHPSNVPHAFA